jgi:hypothetical protein
MFSIKKTAQPPVFIAFFPLITIPTTKSGLKKYASHFFNHALGATGEKEAANPVTDVISTAKVRGTRNSQIVRVPKIFRGKLIIKNARF